jgi:23S rRNA (cytidine1920-2'-O)/16S rRNA (cytidine1409-2'-O)-methyltransferase
MAKKTRLDMELVVRGMVSDRDRAKALIMAGEVLVKEQVIYKADTVVTADDNIQLKDKCPYVSRGALKLEKAFKDFEIDVNGLKALDVGISTGGFTDYMLQHGAESIVGLDVNIQQVDYHLQKDKRLKLIKTNARHFNVDLSGFEPDIITIDVSFISVAMVLPTLAVFKNARIVSLIKPQFEAKAKDVGKGGIVRDPDTRIQVITRLKKHIEEIGFGVTGFTQAGVKGRKGNQEYFFLLEYGKKNSINDTIVTHAIKSEL